MIHPLRSNGRAYGIRTLWTALALFSAVNILAQTPSSTSSVPIYDLLLKGGHVLDSRNNIDSVMDVAIKDGKIAKVAANIAPSDALRTVDAKGLYVAPGLIDIHVHVYAGTGERNSYAGDLAVPPDGFTFRSRSNNRRGCGMLGLAKFRGFQAAHYRPLENPRLCLVEHRWLRYARSEIRTERR